MKTLFLALGALALFSAQADAQLYPSPTFGTVHIDSAAHAAATRQNLGGALGIIEDRFAEPTAAGTGLLARYLFTEGSGSTLDDVSGLGNNATCPTTNGPSWGGDGTLDWTPGVSLACPLPAAITGVRTIEWMTNNTVVLPPASFQKPTPIYNSPIGFSSGLGVSVFFYSTYDSVTTAGSPYQGYGTGYVNFGQQGSAHPDALLGFTDNANHTFALVMNDSADTITLYEDGVALSHATAAPARLAIAMSNVAWELGGQGAASLVATSGFGGHMIAFSASSTAYTAGMVAQDDAAMRLLAAHKGVPSSPFFSAPYQDLDYTIGESVSAAHGLSNQKAMNFTSVADSYLNTAFPADNFTGISNGQDTDNGYIEQASCVALEHGMSQSSGLKFLTFHEHGNALNALTGTYTSVDYWPTSTVSQTAAGIAAANLDAFSKCAAAAKGDGYATIIATGIGYGTPPSPSYRPAYNAYIRTHWSGRFDMLWDPVNDPRLGAEGAGLLTNNCTFGGSTGNTFQSDNLHPTQCGQDIMGQQKASVMAAWLLRGNPETATVAATYPMVMTDLGSHLFVPGGGTITLWPVGGLAPGQRLTTITNNGSLPETVAGGTEYDGGAQDIITSPANGLPAATYSLPPGSTSTFSVTFPTGGDATGGPGGVLAEGAAVQTTVAASLRAPLSTDDSTKGILVGDDWVDPGDQRIFTNVQNTPNFSVWQANSIAGGYPVDDIGGTIPAACYGTKLLRAAYTGALINVENPTTQTPTDIGFMPDGSINTKALWAVAGSAGYVYVDGWYDQCGSTTGAGNANNPNEATQTTLANMPTMTPPGTLGSSYPVIFDGHLLGTPTSKFMNLPSSVAFGTGVPVSLVAVAQAADIETDVPIVGLADTTNSSIPLGFGNFAASAAFGISLGTAGSAINNTVAPSVTPFVAGAVANGTSPASFTWLDAHTAPGSVARGSLALAGGYIGKYITSTNGAFAETSEILLYGRALSTTDEATANAVDYRYFGITPQADACWIANGDSITQDFGTTLDQGYVQQVKPLLTHAFRIFDASIYGQSSSQQKNLLTTLLPTEFSNCLGVPNKVLTEFTGTNDLANVQTLTAAQTGNVLTVTAVQNSVNTGVDEVLTGTGIPTGETIVNQLTGNTDQAGTYTVSANVNPPVASESISASPTAASIYYNDQQIAALAHANGFKFGLSTMLPRSGFAGTNTAAGTNEDSIRLAYNALVTSNAGGFEDFIVDGASDPTMGNEANLSNTALYVGGLHPTNLGDAYLAQLFAAKLNALFP